MRAAAVGSTDILWRWLHRGDHATSGRVAISTRAGEGWSELTYGGLDHRSGAIATTLAAAGIRPGERVALQAEPGGDWVVAFMGILRVGAVAVILDVRLTAGELDALCRRSELTAALVSRDLADGWPDRSVPVLVVSAPVVADPSWLDSPRHLDDPAVLVWTSGTTGDPKGVTLSLANVVYVVEQSSRVQGTGPEVRWLSVLPPNHLLELCCGLLPGLAAGSTTFVTRSIVPHELWSMIADLRVDRMVVVPMVLRLLMRHVESEGCEDDVTRGPLRSFYCGGAPLDPEVVTFFDRLGVGVYQGYGLTEAAPVVSMNSPGHNRPGSVGRPLPGTQVRFSDEGEILVQGPGVMLGYWHDEVASREAVDADGWLRTGDLGHLDGDGYLFVTGRIKSMIVLDSGKKVQPEEVETALSQGELFAEVCVVGWRATQGARPGEQVCAVVVPSVAMSQEEAEAEVRRLSSGLSGFRRPTIVRVHEGQLPRTAKRSLRRAEVVRFLERAEAQ